MKVLTEFERGYLSASIDTDGSLSLYKNKSKAYRGWKAEISLSFSNNSVSYLTRICDMIGSKVKLVEKKNSKNYKISFRHNVLRWLLPQLELTIKENRRLYAIKILNHFKKGINQHTNTSEYEKGLELLVDKFQYSEYD
ncbi:MAG: hypothetical protein GPJ54_07480 [Candidatus Heimdallarchaeota archaeon]|nr:hypothetical protein [Candidatus Heimdallarchaeota archaeon]